MFLGKTELKSLMKSDWKKAGLTIGNRTMPIFNETELANCYVIRGSHWELQIDRRFLDNEVKGLIVALMGKLPMEEVFDVKKDEPDQVRLFDQSDELIWQMEDLDKAEGYLELTQLYIATGSSMHAVAKAYEKKVCINARFLSLLKPDAIMLDHGEAQEDGPYYKDGKVFWYNNVSIFAVETSTMNNEYYELLQKLNKVDL